MNKKKSTEQDLDWEMGIMAFLTLQDPIQGVLIRVQIAPTFVNCVPVIQLQLSSSRYPATIWLVLLLPSFTGMC